MNALAKTPTTVRKKASDRISQVISTPTTTTGAKKNPHLIETPIRNASVSLNNPPI